jgi:hypothetical protein
MKFIILIITIVSGSICLSIPANARLNETPDQLVARYGEPLKGLARIEAHGQLIPSFGFTHGGLVIETWIFNGHCIREVFTCAPGSNVSNWEQTVNDLISANAQGQQWTQVPLVDPLNPVAGWRRNDGATAVSIAGFRQLELTSKEFYDEFRRLQQKAISDEAKSHPAINTSGF